MTPETSPYIMFYSFNCEHCDAMLPLLNQLAEEEDTEIDLIEVSDKDQESIDLYEKLSQGNCEGVPFFFNKETGGWLCGEVSKEELAELFKKTV